MYYVMIAYMKPNYKNWMPKGMILWTLGGTFAIHDIFSRFKYGDMQAFVKKLKGMGYAEVELIDTTNGMFMTPWEAKWMGLSGSAILKGKK